MNVSEKRRPPIRLCALVVLSLGLLFPLGAAQAASSGGVIAWGCGGGADFGQCSVPPGATSGVTAIAAGDYHSLALKQDGSVIAWGCRNGFDFGQCTVPAAASSGVTAIAAAYAHSLALKDNGSVVAWGCSGFDVGQCAVPAEATSGVIAISAGFSHSLALKQNGSVVAWGCGGGANGGQCAVPAAALSGVVAIAAGYIHSLALKQDGSVIAWGCALDVGQCSVPPAATSGVTAIAAGDNSSLALKQDGSVVAWGCGDGYNGGQCDVPPEAASGVTAISGGFYTSLALKDGGVISWGCGFGVGECSVPLEATSGVTAIAAGLYQELALVGSSNQAPDCSAVTATPRTLGQMRDQLALITLSGATDPDGDTLSYRIDGVSQDEYVTGVGDDTSPDAALTAAGANSNKLLLRAEANPQFNGRVYRIAYTVSDGQGGSCSGIAGPNGTTTAKVSVPRKKGTPAVDNGDLSSWNSFSGAPLQSPSTAQEGSRR
jgi:Regulator of chromosome condensation (RCC1) repeat/Bacterial Ig domain